VIAIGRLLRRPSRIRFVSLVSNIEQHGLNAMPIIGILLFLVGIVVAYQGVGQLRRFGAEILTVDLVGISVLREMGVLITSIVVAGRSGSAFTAQIGTMQVNEEVDAIRTLGLDPLEVLVLPRMLALMIALPLLTFFANMMAILGGAFMASQNIDITFAQFLSLLNQAVTLTHFWVGMVKAPVFAFLIAMVGCFEGMRVRGSAESVGRLTTQAVVESLFLVIVFDAGFSVLFTYLGY
jgi:phospholipid/cholesterol/gamma-HCH transport system permease protein